MTTTETARRYCGEHGFACAGDSRFWRASGLELDTLAPASAVLDWTSKKCR